MDGFVDFRNGAFAIGYRGKKRRMAVVVFTPNRKAQIFLPNVGLRLGADFYSLGHDALNSIVDEKGEHFAVYPAEKTGKHRTLIFVDGERPIEKFFSVGKYELMPAISSYF